MLAPLKDRSLIERESPLSLEERVAQLESENLALRSALRQSRQVQKRSATLSATVNGASGPSWPRRVRRITTSAIEWPIGNSCVTRQRSGQKESAPNRSGVARRTKPRSVIFLPVATAPILIGFQ